MKKLYTDPKVAKDFVWFRFFNEATGKWVLRKYTQDANRLAPEEKAKRLKALADFWKYKLEVERFNPLTGQSLPSAALVHISSDPASLTFTKAVAMACERKQQLGHWTKDTKKIYDGAMSFILDAAATLGLGNLLIADFKKLHYEAVLLQAQKERGLDAGGFNKYRQHLSAVIGELVYMEVLEFNPVEKVRKQAAVKTFAHKPPTPEERETIVNHLKQHHPAFYRFCAMIYGTTIREKELCALQVGDIDFAAGLIHIIPNRARANSKTLVEREIVIPNNVLDLLNELQLQGRPADCFVFSKNYLPGFTRMSHHTPGKHWKTIVKKGLKIDRDLYSLKKLAGNDMVDMQMEVKQLLDLPRKQMGHTTSDTTEIYVTRHKEIEKDLIKKRMPGL